jgi:membrane-bound metal-dependent hydrolase YbcI (DUF457 family)
MMGKTHAITGLAAGLSYAAVTGSIATTPIAAYVVAYFAALLPDLDQYSSMAGRHLAAKPAGFILRTFRHRTFTHSLVGMALFSAFAFGVWQLIETWTGTRLSIVFPILASIGYISHPVADSFNKQQIALFWPFKPFGIEWWGPIPIRALRISTIHDNESKIPWRFWRIQSYLHTEKWFWLYPMYLVIAVILVRDGVTLAHAFSADMIGFGHMLPAPLSDVAHFLFG